MSSFDKDVEAASKVVKDGGIILYPTDTIWGIGCDALNDSAIEKIFKLKKRSPSKAMIVLMRDEIQVAEYVDHPSQLLLRSMETNQQATTAIFERTKKLPKVLVADSNSIAIRIPREEFCQALLNSVKRPLVSTSANLAGEVSAGTYPSVPPEIKNGVDYIVQHRRNDLSISKPSTIIRLSKTGNIERLR